MNKVQDLAEQHILESASRLRHIDELMTRARTVVLKEETATRTEPLLMQIESERNKLARELEELQRLPRGEGSDIVMRAEGLKGLLEAVGLQLEQVLAAVFKLNK